MARRLNPQQKKYVSGIVKGKSQAQAYIEAGYKAKNKDILYSNASRLAAKPKIAIAIEQALDFHGATPEFAVGRLKSIAEQDKEIGASRLAAKDILELHGWKRGEKPSVTLDIKQAFFKDAREIIDVEPV